VGNAQFALYLFLIGSGGFELFDIIYQRMLEVFKLIVQFLELIL
jgi:hypothetical protein